VHPQIKLLDGRDPGVRDRDRHRLRRAFGRRDERAGRRDLELLRDRRAPTRPSQRRASFSLGCDPLVGDDRYDPAHRDAVNFFHRLHNAGDRRAVDGQPRLHPTKLGEPTTPRQFWISRLERRLHAVTNNGRGTQYSSATIRRISANR
jgi:hypothetical protein